MIVRIGSAQFALKTAWDNRIVGITFFLNDKGVDFYARVYLGPFIGLYTHNFKVKKRVGWFHARTFQWILEQDGWFSLGCSFNSGQFLFGWNPIPSHTCVFIGPFMFQITGVRV